MSDDDVALFCVSLMAKLGIPNDVTVDEWSSDRCKSDFTYSYETCAELGFDFDEVLEYFEDIAPRCDCGIFSDE